MSTRQDVTNRLHAIGFNKLEADVYVTLLRESPLTGYRIAKLLGKAAANTYKALESLKDKGAVVVEEGTNNKFYSAVSLDDYFHQLESSLKTSKLFLEEHLHRMATLPSENKIHWLKNYEQLEQKLISMITNSVYTVIVDAFPPLLESITPHLITASKAGVRIVINAYEPIEIPGCQVIIKENAQRVMKLWAGDWINIAVDGREFLISAVSKDVNRTAHALWSNSAFLSFFQFNGFRYEMMFSRLAQHLKKLGHIDVVDDVFRELEGLSTTNLPGYLDLLDQFGEDE
ncbi:hypothetical protein KAH37_00390 [bacterium]|nr:hypothetical protein [bacterium]